jgi:pimeloyl-ACP methyl ester carboxylesterase
METFESSDGTIIAFERVGSGPGVVLVGGALTDRTGGRDLARALAPSCTVYCYDRRGRGGSGDSPPYQVELEVEDLEALILHTGSSAAVFAKSSGAALALLAAAEGVAMDKLVVFEPPYIVDDSRSLPPADLPARVRGMIASGRPGDAVERFLVESVGVPAEAVLGIEASPEWPAMQALAPTVLHDLAIMGDSSIPDRLSLITVPTLVLDSSGSAPFLRTAAAAVAGVVPGASHRTLEGPNHGYDPEMAAQVLVEFLAS